MNCVCVCVYIYIYTQIYWEQLKNIIYICNHYNINIFNTHILSLSHTQTHTHSLSLSLTHIHYIYVRVCVFGNFVYAMIHTRTFIYIYIYILCVCVCVHGVLIADALWYYLNIFVHIFCHHHYFDYKQCWKLIFKNVFSKYSNLEYSVVFPVYSNLGCCNVLYW